MNQTELIKYASENNVEIVDFKFCDFPGTWHHFSTPISCLNEDLFEEGLGFDGSSIRGFQSIQESDMLLFPDPESAFLDPFTKHPTLSITCNIKDPITAQPYTRDPRFCCELSPVFHAPSTEST